MEDKKSLPIGITLHGKKDYTITAVLGKGGYGITYLAQHTQQGHNIPDRYAIKEFFMSNCCERNADGSVTLSDTNGKSAKDYKKAFMVEAEHLKDLNQYSGIVHVQEIFEANGTVYYVMEHLGDTNLTKLLAKQGGKLDEALAVRMTGLIGRSLALLHQKKMNHLDVKPDNVMLVGDAATIQPVLIDFGLSRHYNIMGKVTNDRTAMGYSDGYSPAEQYVGLDEFSPSADVYALAATLFHMLTGHAPERATKITEAYLRDGLKGKTSEQRITAIVEAMRMNATERTQSVEAFLSALGIVTEQVASTGGTVDITQIRKPGINKIYVAGLVVIAILVGMVVYLMGDYGQDHDTPQETIQDTVRIDNADMEQATQSAEEQTQQENTQTEAETTQQNSSAATQQPAAQQQPQTTVQPQKQQGSQSAVKPTPKKGPIDLGYAIWDGETRNGKPDGYGTMTYKTDRQVDSRDANGTYAATGDKMKGEFSNGHWVYGTLYSHSGAVKAKISIGAE